MSNTASSGGSSTMTQPRGGSSSSSSSFSLDRLRRWGWTAVDVLTLFGRSLIDPNVRSMSDIAGSSGGRGGMNGTGVRHVHTVHGQAVRGSGPMAGGSGGRRLDDSSSSSSSSSSSGGGNGNRMGRVSGLGPVQCAGSK